MVNESLYEYKKQKKLSKRSLKKLQKDFSDEWPDILDADFYMEPEEIDDDELDKEEEIFDDRLIKILTNELKVIEPNRRYLKFRFKNNLNKIYYGIPMAKLSNEAFLFKLGDGTIKKIRLNDIVAEY